MLDARGQSIARELFVALVDRRDGRDARRPQEFREIVELVGEDEREGVLKVIETFRADGVGFLLPSASVAIDDQTVIDISHESLIRRWRRFQLWLTAEAGDVTELREWQLRAARREHGSGSWLDENDCGLADKWRARVQVRSNPAAWAKRYACGGSYAEVSPGAKGASRRPHRLGGKHCIGAAGLGMGDQRQAFSGHPMAKCS